MKKTLFALALFCVAHPASAHILVTDQGVGAVFHVDPNDAPTPDATSTVSAIFQSESFDLSTCNCDLSLSKDGRLIFDKQLTDPLFKVTPHNVTFHYMFPSAGAYSVAIAGEDFRLVYNFEVRPDPTKQVSEMSSRTHILHLVLFAVAIAYGGYILLSDRNKSKRPYV
jgi:hypothetical protein